MSVLVAFAVVLFVSMPAQASSQVDETFIGASQQNLPAFMQDLDATLMTEAEMAEVRGEGWIDVTIKVVDWLGRVQTVYTVAKWFFFTPGYSTCVYSGTANSTPMHCY